MPPDIQTHLENGVQQKRPRFVTHQGGHRPVCTTHTASWCGHLHAQALWSTVRPGPPGPSAALPELLRRHYQVAQSQHAQAGACASGLKACGGLLAYESLRRASHAPHEQSRQLCGGLLRCGLRLPCHSGGPGLGFPPTPGSRDSGLSGGAAPRACAAPAWRMLPVQTRVGVLSIRDACSQPGTASRHGRSAWTICGCVQVLPEHGGLVPGSHSKGLADIRIKTHGKAWHAAHAHLGRQCASSRSGGVMQRLCRSALSCTPRQRTPALGARGPESPVQPDRARRPAASPQRPAALAWGSAAASRQPQLWAMGGSLRSVHLVEKALLALSRSRLAMGVSKVPLLAATRTYAASNKDCECKGRAGGSSNARHVMSPLIYHAPEQRRVAAHLARAWNATARRQAPPQTDWPSAVRQQPPAAQ